MSEGCGWTCPSCGETCGQNPYLFDGGSHEHDACEAPPEEDE